MSIQSTEETVGSYTKIERYKWDIRDEPGVFLDIPKHDLLVDDSYQRDCVDPKIARLTKDWSWIACGALIVADRDGLFYVIDGQHRLMAARKRSDIKSLPCMVFSAKSIVEEAGAFNRANSNRKPLTGVERFKALVMSRDPIALFVQRLCSMVGRQVKNDGASDAVRCVSTMMKHAQLCGSILERLWPIMNQIMEGQPMNEKIVDALVFIEQHMPQGHSITDKFWKERLMRVGATGLLAGAQRAASFYSKGGAKVWAIGMVQALNYKARLRLELRGVTESSSAE